MTPCKYCKGHHAPHQVCDEYIKWLAEQGDSPVKPKIHYEGNRVFVDKKEALEYHKDAINKLIETDSTVRKAEPASPSGDNLTEREETGGDYEG